MPVQIEEAMRVIRQHAPQFKAKVGMILGSGLSPVADAITNPITIPYQSIPGLEVGKVSGHPSLLMMGTMEGVPVVCMKGRLHLYEGTPYAMLQMLVRIMKHLGCEVLIITGASGSLRPEVGPGEIMIINDHINWQPGNPLIGPNDESVGPRFVSLEDAYDLGLRTLLKEVGSRLGYTMHEGVYLSTIGPVFETPAEIRAFRTLGADAVGMSVVPEVILARHAGMQVVGISAITNLAVGLSREKVTHEVTLGSGERLSRTLSKLIPAFVKAVDGILF
jgi:xanthosine phosphorylase